MEPPMCACPELPVNEWRDRDGRVVESRTIGASSGDSDGGDFLDHPTAVSWRIVCPQCGRLFAAGNR